MSRCVIFAAGDMPSKIDIRDDDLIICADGGIDIANKFGITNFLAIGDFDSYDGEILNGYTVLLPEKDDTDLIAAINLGLKHEFYEFALYGCLGGRLDHTLANIQTLGYLNERGAKGMLISDDCKVILLDGDSLVVENDEDYRYISIFSYDGSAVGVTIEGLKYEVANIELTSTYPLGVSNEFIGKRGKISVNEGKLIIILTK